MAGKLGAGQLELKGKRFGKLLVVEPIRHNGKAAWLCLCDCGNTVKTTSGSLNFGAVKSCGCSKQDASFRRRLSEVRTTHGLFGTPEYRTWGAIINRCENPKSKSWLNYGGRGIAVAEVWRNSPEQFLKDMGPKPGKGWSIERLDVNGPYSPENCVWATAKEQANNTRSNVNLTYKGVTKTLTQWAEELGIHSNSLRDRITARNGSVEEALEWVPQQRGNHITYEGQTKSVSEWADTLGFSRRGLAKRLKIMTVEEAFNKPKRVWPNASNE